MKLKERIKYWGISGAVLGGLLGLSFGYRFIYFPGIGSPLISGLIIGWIFTGISGAMVVGGLSALAAGIYNLGLAPDSILQSEKFGLSTHDAIETTIFARKIINRISPEVWEENQSSLDKAYIERWEHGLRP